MPILCKGEQRRKDNDKMLAELSAKGPATWLRSQEEAGLRPQEAKAEELCVQGQRVGDL